MPRLLRRSTSSLFVVIAIAVLAPHVRAQCATGGVSYNGVFVAMVPNNPFYAKLTMTRSKLPGARSEGPLEISRDHLGHLRLDRFVATVRVQSGPDAGAEVEEHAVTIYDPLKCEQIQMDTVSHSAMITHMWAGPLAHPRAPIVETCGSEFDSKSYPRIMNAISEDLGHQTIETFDTIGVRFTMHQHIPDAIPDAVIDRANESWCSQDLEAVLLHVMRGGTAGEPITYSMSEIQRAEPEASLFEIPAGYTVSEAAPSQPAVTPVPVR
jgi:hypothetical protein